MCNKEQHFSYNHTKKTSLSYQTFFKQKLRHLHTIHSKFLSNISLHFVLKQKNPLSNNKIPRKKFLFVSKWCNWNLNRKQIWTPSTKNLKKTQKILFLSDLLLDNLTLPNKILPAKILSFAMKKIPYTIGDLYLPQTQRKVGSNFDISIKLFCLRNLKQVNCLRMKLASIRYRRISLAISSGQSAHKRMVILYPMKLSFLIKTRVFTHHTQSIRTIL